MAEVARKESVVLGRRGTREEYFWIKVDVDEATGCWNWLGAHDRSGYPMFGVPGRPSLRAHRWAYENFKAEFDEALTLDHLCRNKGCVNPDHLEPVTREENFRRWAETLPPRPAKREPRQPAAPVLGVAPGCCLWCGIELLPTRRADTRYCSPPHRNSAYRYRIKVAA